MLFKKMNNIEIKICQLIKDKLGKDVSLIKDDASFRDDLEVDSLDFIELIQAVEKEFNISISDDTYEKLTTGALNAYVAKNADPDLIATREMSVIEED